MDESKTRIAINHTWEGPFGLIEVQDHISFAKEHDVNGVNVGQPDGTPLNHRTICLLDDEKHRIFSEPLTCEIFIRAGSIMMVSPHDDHSTLFYYQGRGLMEVEFETKNSTSVQPPSPNESSE